jgi:hypothetical protein
VALLLALGPLALLGASAELPPRPDPTPKAPPQPPTTEETASLELQATFPSTWPWTRAHWQTPWTVVQWQDEEEDWHVVEGWQGTLDTVEPGAGGAMVGRKVWGVARRDFDTGPFRWLVYADRSQEVRLATSAPFYLPGGPEGTRVVTLTLKP